jgi:carbamoyltransferase
MRPDIPNGKDIINQKVKHREWWRPFGASVKQDKASKYFDLDNSPYMLYTAKVLKDDLPSITHADGTCRHQTVTPEQNSVFYNLLDAFESKTGLPVLLNTSLNLGGKPIAGKIEEAVELFQNSEMDALCVGDELYVK